MHLHRGLPSEIHTSENIQLKDIYYDRKRCLSFLKKVMGLCSTIAFVNSYLSYPIMKPFWKAGGKAFKEVPPLPSLCYSASHLLLSPMLFPISNLLPLHQLWGLSYPSTDLFQFPKTAGKKLPGKLFVHKLFYLPTSSVSRPVCWKAKFMQWSAQSMWAVCLWRYQMQHWECSLWLFPEQLQAGRLLRKAFCNSEWLQEQSDFAAPFVLLSSCAAASAACLSACMSSTSCMGKLIEWLPAALTCYPALEWVKGYDMTRRYCRRPSTAQKLPHCSPGLHSQAWALSVLKEISPVSLELHHTSRARAQTDQTPELPEEPLQFYPTEWWKFQALFQIIFPVCLGLFCFCFYLVICYNPLYWS